MSNFAGSPDERLSRDYQRQKQAPRVPRNIIRNPIRVPGHGLPMERVQAADGFDALREAINAAADEPEPDEISPFCMNCGAGADYGTEVCEDCGGDVYDPTAP